MMRGRKGPHTALRRLWYSMHVRCRVPTHSNYRSYGGRGIVVCARWHVFENFLADMGERPEGMTLDRIDNDGPYSPENCRWATKYQQARNCSRNYLVTFAGETLCLTAMAEKYGLSRPALHGRLLRGWEISRALFTPVAPSNRRGDLRRK